MTAQCPSDPVVLSLSDTVCGNFEAVLAGYDLTEDQLRQFFSQFGDAVTDVYLPRYAPESWL